MSVGHSQRCCPCATQGMSSGSLPRAGCDFCPVLQHLHSNPAWWAAPILGTQRRQPWEHPWAQQELTQSSVPPWWEHWSFGKQLLGCVLEAPSELTCFKDTSPADPQVCRDSGSCSSSLPNPPHCLEWMEQDTCPSVPTQSQDTSTAALEDCSGSEHLQLSHTHQPPSASKSQRLEKPSRIMESSL